MLKIPSSVINDKLIPILSSFFADVCAESVEEARIIVYGWRQALKVRELGPEKGPSEFFSRSVSRVLRKI